MQSFFTTMLMPKWLKVLVRPTWNMQVRLSINTTIKCTTVVENAGRDLSCEWHVTGTQQQPQLSRYMKPTCRPTGQDINTLHRLLRCADGKFSSTATRWGKGGKRKTAECSTIRRWGFRRAHSWVLRHCTDVMYANLCIKVSFGVVQKVYHKLHGFQMLLVVMA